MEIEPFGEIDQDNLESFYSGEILVDNQVVEIDLNFEADEIEYSELEKVVAFIDAVDSRAKEAFEAISDDYDLEDRSEVARFYLQNHLDDFTEEEVKSVFGTTVIDKDVFLSSLKLVRIGLYPEEMDACVIFDIQFPQQITQYVMAVTFDSAGRLSYISMDS